VLDLELYSRINVMLFSKERGFLNLAIKKSQLLDADLILKVVYDLYVASVVKEKRSQGGFRNYVLKELEKGKIDFVDLTQANKLIILGEKYVSINL
jgi:hypothetical protein